MQDNILRDVSQYYSEKVTTYGATPEGVDWNGYESQKLRFEQLAKLIDQPSFSVNDLGCGYGAFYAFLKDNFINFSYTGYDISNEMIAEAQKLFEDVNTARFLKANAPNSIADFGFASGIFNVRLNKNDEEWLGHIKHTLDILNSTSQNGFAFNCLTSYSDEDKKRDYLYYADPCLIFDYCKTHFSRHVALQHDYGLYEFTILVRKT